MEMTALKERLHYLQTRFRNEEAGLSSVLLRCVVG
jgi:hypothetical protein